MSQPDLRLRGLRLRVGDEVSELDLSKYEGHTEGPWFVREVHPGRSNTPKFQVAPTAERGTFAVAELVRGTRPIREREQNARLIADAPLLLAEVRRLREERETLHGIVRLLRDTVGENIKVIAALRQSHARLLEALLLVGRVERRGGVPYYNTSGSLIHQDQMRELGAAVAEAEALS